MTIQEKLYTADDLWNMPDNGRGYDLVRGKLEKIMSPTGVPHGLITAEIAFLLRAFVKTHRLGQIYGAETGFKLAENPDIVYGVDVAFVRTARAQTAEGYFKGAPDLAVEVVSRGNSMDEMHAKIQDYFNAGTTLVWIVYIKSRTIYVYTAEDKVSIRHASDTLDGGDLLPGLSIIGSDIFSVLDE